MSLALDPTQHLCFSNRSAAHLKLGAAEAARRDAKRCVELEPRWPKGYARQAAAALLLERWDEVEHVCATCAEAADDSLNGDIANVLMKMWEEAARGRARGPAAST